MSTRAYSLDLRLVRQFLAVAESRSFRKAAEHMNMAQPPLSQAIMRLESQLETVLFDRSPQGVRLTVAGEVFRVEAQRLLNQAERAVQRTQQAGRGERGDVHVAFIGPAMFALLSRTILAFQARFPDVKLHLHEGSSVEVARLLDSASVEIGFLVTPAVFATDVVVEEIVVDSLIAVLPAGHRLEGRPQIGIEELAHDAFVLFSAKGVPTLSAKMHGLCQQAGFEPRIAQDAVQISTVLGLVAGGLGVSLLPESVRTLRPAGVIYKSISADPLLLQVNISVAYRREPLGEVAKAFLATARSCARAGDHFEIGQRSVE